MNKLGFLVVTVCALAPLVAQAQPAAPYPNYPPGYGPVLAAPAAQGTHAHDGFFLRLAIGPGYTGMSSTVLDTDVSISGAGFGLAAAFGGAVSRNLILFGEVVDSRSIDPKVKVGGESGTGNGSAGAMGIGPGLAWYTDSNFYLSGTALLAWGVLSDDDANTDDDAETDTGFGANLMFGKEWWVSDNWGLGGALQFLGVSAPDKANLGGETPKWTILAMNFLFSATFN